jgi:D-alanyl-lipoteichoic acid acyltransferase DltB (MBOAT superfamily)
LGRDVGAGGRAGDRRRHAGPKENRDEAPVLYNSYPFIFVFLPLSLLLYFGLARVGHGLADAVLAGMSLVFYAAWDWRDGRWDGHDLLLIVGSITLNFAAGAVLARRRSRAALAAGVVANLAVLAYFKYANFAAANLAALAGHAFEPWSIVLPLGISFFTFTQIAFLVDAHRGRAGELNLSRYGLFVTFFPHLIAGPIVHHGQLAPQFATRDAKRWTPANVHVGLAFFTIGLFKKVAIADTCAPWANEVFGVSGAVGCPDAWRGALAWTFQLYFDFSGYSDMAIGLAMLFNVRLPDNFHAPYRAASVTDFWRRWHITLSRFLRDYLYVPLGGNRRGPGRRTLNLLVTMLLGGLWHGAGWTYVIWGAYHGVLLIANHAWRRGAAVPMPVVPARALTFLAVVAGWVVFRAPDTGKALTLLGNMVGLAGASASSPLVAWDVARWQWALLAALLVFANVAPTTKQWVQGGRLGAGRAVLLGTLLFVSLFLMRTAFLRNAPAQFIYFQF